MVLSVTQQHFAHDCSLCDAPLSNPIRGKQGGMEAARLAGVVVIGGAIGAGECSTTPLLSSPTHQIHRLPNHVEFAIATNDKDKAVTITGPNDAPLQSRKDAFSGRWGHVTGAIVPTEEVERMLPNVSTATTSATWLGMVTGAIFRPGTEPGI